MNDRRLPVIGLMLGDATGVGPELCAKVLARGAVPEAARVVVVGDARVLALGMKDAGVDFPVRTYARPAAVDWSAPGVPLVDLGNVDPSAFERAKPSPESGRLCGETLKTMIEWALAGELDAVSFAPLNKGAMFKGGWRYHDEHQMFAKLTGHAGFFGEMNVIREFCTFRVTSHVALREAVNMVTPERIGAAVRLAHATLTRIGHAKPRIGVAALNPHCGENGLFGDEEIRIIRPTVEQLNAEGVGCVGPISSDVVFLKARDGEFDAVVMMYHDQGQVATKLLGFHKGVTVTAGLPAVFTTPAHGTAYDITGRGVADTGALEHALSLAAKLSAHKANSPGGNPWPSEKHATGVGA